MNIVTRPRIQFKIPDHITTIALPVSSSFQYSFVDFSVEIPLDGGRVARYVISKPAGDDEIVLPNIIPVGGIVLDKDQKEKQIGYLRVERGRYPSGYVTLEKVDNGIWKVSAKEPQAYLLKVEEYEIIINIKSIDECQSINIETKNVIDYVLICKEMKDKIEPTFYFLLPTDKIAEIVIKMNEEMHRYKIVWDEGNPRVVEIDEEMNEDLLV